MHRRGRLPKHRGDPPQQMELIHGLHSFKPARHHGVLESNALHIHINKVSLILRLVLERPHIEELSLLHLLNHFVKILLALLELVPHHPELAILSLEGELLLDCHTAKSLVHH